MTESSDCLMLYVKRTNSIYTAVNQRHVLMWKEVEDDKIKYSSYSENV